MAESDKAGRILIVHSCTIFGGAERSLLDIISSVPDKTRYTVALNPGTELDAALKDLGIDTVAVHFAGFTKRDILRRPCKFLYNLLRCSAFLKHFAGNNDFRCVVANTHRQLPYLFRIRGNRIPIICMCRDNVRYRWEKYIINCMSDRIICVSAHIRSRLGEHSRSVVLHNGVLLPDKAVAGKKFFTADIPTGEKSWGRSVTLSDGKTRLTLSKWRQGFVKKEAM